MERTPLVSIIIPVGNYHHEIAEQAIQSGLAQSIYCPIIVVYDTECHGAGWARNRGLEHVSTPFVVFLDSDDRITPDFVETMLLAYDGQHYCYSDWFTDKYIHAPCAPWDGTGAAHIVTTLLPTQFVQRVGGFDESLPGLEDTDLFWKLTRAGLCGKRVPEALFYYGKGGQRAQAFRDRPDSRAIGQAIIKRYEGLPMACNGCGTDNQDLGTAPAGTPFDGAVLATALWAGNRQERGRMTGMTYPRTGNGKKLFVHERDIDAAPHLFARVVELPPPVTESDLAPFRQFFGSVVEAFGGRAPVLQEPAAAGAQRGEVKPDVGRVLRLYGNVAAAGE